MADTIISSAILDKKLDDYHYENENLIAEGEITVTITLYEYRKLVKADATAESRIAKANEDKYSRESENDRLKEENARLKAELYELQKNNSCAESEAES